MKKATVCLAFLLILCLETISASAASVAPTDLIWLPQYCEPDTAPSKTQFLAPFSAGGITSAKQNDEYLFITGTGEPAFDNRYSLVNSFCEHGRATVYSNGTFSIIDETGATIVLLDGYSYVSEFNEGVAKVEKDRKFGFINENGTLLFLTDEYDTVDDTCSEGLILVGIGTPGTQKFGYINLQGELAIPCQYDRAERFCEGLAVVGVYDGKLSFGAINRSGNFVIPPRYEALGQHHDGLAYARTFGQYLYGYLDSAGKVAMPFEYHSVSDFSEGLAKVWIYAFDPRDPISIKDMVVISTQGNIAFEYASSLDLVGANLYDDVGRFSEGLAVVSTYSRVESKKKYGYIDRTGEIVIPLEYDMAYDFSNGYAWVAKDSGNGVELPEEGSLGIIKNPLKANTMSPWAVDGIQSASVSGLVTQSTNQYYTYQITRLQFAELAVNLAEKATGVSIVPAETGRFSDTDDLSVRKAAAAGIVSGTGDGSTYSPNRFVTREQIAAMLMRTMRYIEEQQDETYLEMPADLSGYADAGQVAPWAKEAVGILKASNIMQGTSTSALSPRSSTTVEQAILLILRAQECCI